MHLSKGGNSSSNNNSNGNGNGNSNTNASSVISSQQRLYIAPHSSIRPPDTETTTAVTQLDTNARRRRQTNSNHNNNNSSYHNNNNNNNNNSMDFGMIATTTTTTYSPVQSSPSERSNTHCRTYGGSVSKKKKLLQYAATITPMNRRSNHRCHDSDHYSSSDCPNDDDDHGNVDDDDDDDDDDSIMDNINAPNIWMMEDMEGGNVTLPPVATTPIREPASRQRKSHPKSGHSYHSSTSSKRNFSKSKFYTHPSSGSIKSESKYHSSRQRHTSGMDHNNDNDDHSVHTYHTMHSLQQEVQSKLMVDLGGATTPGETRHPKVTTALTRSGHKKYIRARHNPSNHSSILYKCHGHFLGGGRHGSSSSGGGGGSGTASNSDGTKNRCIRFLFPFVQAMVGIIFIYILYDTRRRNISHQQQLLLLDEERAHILEQMTWIDNAAKKVHKKYGTASVAGNNALLVPSSTIDNTKTHSDGSSNVQLYKDENKQLHSKIDILQLRVQQNARTRTSIQFGDEPVQVSLPISEGSVINEHYVIALSDDAPHAVNTFLQQVTIGLWNEIDFQQMQNGRVIQASTRYGDTKPILEFVEQSRGCHTAGSVALHQLESDDFRVMVLKIHMDASAKVDPDDVCIGNVVKGFELLERILPQLPMIQAGTEKV